MMAVGRHEILTFPGDHAVNFAVEDVVGVVSRAIQVDPQIIDFFSR